MPIFGFSRRPNVQELKSKGDIEGLIEALSYPNDPNIRFSAAAALGRIGDSKAVKSLIQALEDDPRVVEAAVKSLGEIGDPIAVINLIATIKGANWEIKGAIAKALGRLNSKRAIKSLIDLLEDEDEYVRWHASQALESITGGSFGEDITKWKEFIEIRKVTTEKRMKGKEE